MSSEFSVKPIDEVLDEFSDVAIKPRSGSYADRDVVLLVSSSGGHWVQMNRLVSAFQGSSLHFASTERDYSQVVESGRFHYVPDASESSTFFQIGWQALRVLLLILSVRPDVVVTTGAAPGYFALLFAKKMGAKTIWIDSVANVDRISLSGRKAAKHADLFLTQWEHLACEGGPVFYGSVV